MTSRPVGVDWTALRNLAADLLATAEPDAGSDGRLAGVAAGHVEMTLECPPPSLLSELAGEGGAHARLRVVPAGGYVVPREITAVHERELVLSTEGSTTVTWSAGTLHAVDDAAGDVRTLAAGDWMWVAPVDRGRRCSLVWTSEPVR